MTASDAAARPSDGRSRTARRPRWTTSIIWEIPCEPAPAAMRRRIQPPTKAPAAGRKIRSSGGSDSPPATMSSASNRSFVNRTERARNPTAPKAPATPTAAASRRNWVLGSLQKKRPKTEGRVGAGASGEDIPGASGELIPLFGSPGSRRLRPNRRRRRSARTGRRRTDSRPAARRTNRRRCDDRARSDRGCRRTPRCRPGSRRWDPACDEYTVARSRRRPPGSPASLW